MKVKSLSIRNIGAIASTDIPFNQPLLLFYGQIRQGKTTILNAVRWAFGGAFPAGVLTEGADSGSIRVEFDNGYSVTGILHCGRPHG